MVRILIILFFFVLPQKIKSDDVQLSDNLKLAFEDTINIVRKNIYTINSNKDKFQNMLLIDISDDPKMYVVITIENMKESFKYKIKYVYYNVNYNNIFALFIIKNGKIELEPIGLLNANNINEYEDILFYGLQKYRKKLEYKIYKINQQRNIDIEKLRNNLKRE